MTEAEIQEIMVLEFQIITSKYIDSNEKTCVEQTSCQHFGKEDVLDFESNKEVEFMEWKHIVLFYMAFFALLSLISIYDIFSLESKVDVPQIALLISFGITVVLFVAFLLLRYKRTVAFTLTKNGLIMNGRLYEWKKTNVVVYNKKGRKFLLIKPIHEEEFLVSLYFLKQYPTRIICWIDKFKNHLKS